MSPTVPSRSTDVVRRQVAGETLLIPVRGHLADLQSIFGLNAVGRFIWDRLDGSTSPAALAESIAAAFEVPADKATSDVADFLSALQSSGLLQAAP